MASNQGTKRDATVLIADDQLIIVEGLCSLIESKTDLHIVGTVDDGLSAFKMVGKLNPDIVLTEVNLSKMNGVILTQKILECSDSTKVIALSSVGQKRNIEAMIQAGVSGYVLKDCGFEELIRCIDEVLSGRTYLCKEVEGKIIDSYLRLIKNISPFRDNSLTMREKEVLQLVAEGYSTHRIADSLHISTKTVETHRRKIMTKLEIKTIAGLTKYAIKEGYVSL